MGALEKENPADSESDDPQRVPLGLGPKYLEQAKSLRLDKERRRKERQLEEKLRLKRRAERELSRLNRPPKPVKQNPILRTDNASGFRGVYKTGERFRAQIGVFTREPIREFSKIGRRAWIRTMNNASKGR